MLVLGRHRPEDCGAGGGPGRGSTRRRARRPMKRSDTTTALGSPRVLRALERLRSVPAWATIPAAVAIVGLATVLRVAVGPQVNLLLVYVLAALLLSWSRPPPAADVVIGGGILVDLVITLRLSDGPTWI